MSKDTSLGVSWITWSGEAVESFGLIVGYSKKFGLVRIERPSLTRVVKDSFIWYSNLIRENE